MLWKTPQVYGGILTGYTAYAKREIDFIIQSIHPLNQNFEADIKDWRQQIDANCYDYFELTQCKILDEQLLNDTTATVTFVAHMVQRDSRERTAFQETSTFEKMGGAWLYKEGKIEDPPGRNAQRSQEMWPRKCNGCCSSKPFDLAAKSDLYTLTHTIAIFGWT